ncbi:MAG: hypothetical protein ACI9T7_002086 [Oleiphilaceae bacterium]|jgi:hypothetical protein
MNSIKKPIYPFENKEINFSIEFSVAPILDGIDNPKTRFNQ